MSELNKCPICGETVETIDQVLEHQKRHAKK